MILNRCESLVPCALFVISVTVTVVNSLVLALAPLVTIIFTMLAAIVFLLPLCPYSVESKGHTESRSSARCLEDNASRVDEYAGCGPE